MKILAPILLILAGLIGYYHWLYPPTVLRRQAQKSLEAFTAAVDSKDRAKIQAALGAFFTDDAKIRLRVSFFSITQPNKETVQDFDKPTFLTFIDNVIYPLSDYGMFANLEDFTLADDRKTAGVALSAKEWADGVSLYGGVSVGVRFSADTTCQGQAVFADKQPAKLSQLDCALTLRTVPKPEEAMKIQQNPEALRDLLK